VDGDVCHLSATLALVAHEKNTTDSHADHAKLHSEIVALLNTECAECWLMGYRIRYPAHPPHTAHCVFHGQRCVRHDSACFSQITTHRFKFSDPDIDADIPSMQPEIFYRMNHLHEMHICTLRINTCRHYCCCHCSCYRYYCPSLITVCTCTNPQHGNPVKRSQKYKATCSLKRLTRKRWRI
jgi:hypothetical protein